MMKSKKIFSFIIFLIVFSLAILVIFKNQTFKKNNTVILKDNLNIEINSQITLSQLISEKNKVKIVNENMVLDTSKLGKQEIIAKYQVEDEELEKVFAINIVDTQKPVITYTKNLTTIKGNKIDLLKNVKAEDNSKEKINITIEGTYDISKEGTYNLKYVATDSSGNKAIENFTLKVNNDGQENPNLIVTKEEIENEKYFIPSNLERYLAYNDGTKTAKEIVTDVNCNIDKPFYTNIKSADVSKGYLILVNKYYAVDRNYKPANLTPLSTKYTYYANSSLATEAYDSYIKMIDDARNLGYKLIDTSNLRSYGEQEYLFNKYTKENGLEWALKSSAKPGHSEHETGLASDIVKQGVSMYDFVNTKEFVWLKNNAHKYGFILRYPDGKEYLTGYKYEPWHYRYVGKEVAEYIYNNDIVFEEYYAYFCEYKGVC